MTDERDPKVSQRYRELRREEPSRELDQSILAAAHRSADRAHAPLVTPAGRQRWYFALGAAAVLVLAVAVTVQVERERPDPEAASVPAASAQPAQAARRRIGEEPQRSDATDRQAAAEAEASRQVAAMEAERARLRELEAERKADVARREAVMRAEAPRQRPPEEQAKAQQEKREAAAEDRSSARTSAAPAAPAVQVFQAETPERWLERIAQLRKEGRQDAADKELAEFRKRYPDYKLPENVVRP